MFCKLINIKKKKKKRFLIINVIMDSNLEGNRLANESLDVFLQLLCPVDVSIIGM